MKKKVIVAIDVPTKKEALKILKKLNPSDCYIKVGLELFTSEGPEIIRVIKKLGFDIFLDLKLHDIPNTVNRTIKSLAKLGVWMITVHCLGSSEMLKAAINSVKQIKNRPLIIGVTVLTSMHKSNLKEIGMNDGILLESIRLSKLAKKCGLDGVICSANEAKEIRKIVGQKFLLVTPGIRPKNLKDDQKRTATPKMAIENGADYLVIGRPITQSNDPSQSLRVILNQIN